jgi:hypothetical protein
VPGFCFNGGYNGALTIHEAREGDYLLLDVGSLNSLRNLLHSPGTA